MKVASLTIDSKHFANFRLKEREHIISMILKSMELFRTWKTELTYEIGRTSILDNQIRITIIKDKMSRIIIEQKNQIESYCFPFNFQVEDGIIFSFREYELETLDIFKLNIIMKKYNSNNSLDIFLNILLDIDSEFYTKIDVSSIINMLISFDIGYLRFDYDTANEDGKKHPLNHIDINLKNSTHYKIGVNETINIEKLHDIICTDTECWYIEQK